MQVARGLNSWGAGRKARQLGRRAWDKTDMASGRAKMWDGTLAIITRMHHSWGPERGMHLGEASRRAGGQGGW